ncbi:molybdopterin molybdotransferase MoeA [Streptomyces indicus]|uniref:Molybdopterin molybdenumtransferase n=1 Tax=Streptomyces indicus TaxID=417292 RepID=A0A1G9CPF6_9ACTN|nr:molybdopterin molybdotransferase MoeA [Streptomyces indicus]SDK53603.1 molybdopterin molybdotransferase [Streptomyces indicus]
MTAHPAPRPGRRAPQAAPARRYSAQTGPGHLASDDGDLDVDEALALVNEAAGRPGSAPGGPHPHAGGPNPGRPDSHPGAAAGADQVPGGRAPEHPHPSVPSAAGGTAAQTGHKKHDHPRATPWPEARARAAQAARRAPRREAVAVPLDAALGRILATPLTALTDLPSFDTSAMDGWAVAGPGPWDVRPDAILAGHARPASLADGEAVRIATGARVPQEATAVLRSEHGALDDHGGLHPQREVVHGQDIRPRGQECRSGDQLLPAGSEVTPAVLGLAAAAGYDELRVIARPRAEVLILGDELLTEGLPQEGLIRDALGPMLPPWLRSLGAEVIAVRRIGDDAQDLLKAVGESPADVVVTTGGTAFGPVDHVHPTLRALGADLLVDGVQVRPGHPMLLAQLPGGRHLVGLPGNPLATVSGLLTLAEPLLRRLAGRPAVEPYHAPTREEIHGHPYDTRLVPVVLRGERSEEAVPLHYNGPAMLRGIAASDGLAVVPPGGAKPGQELEILDLPWALSTLSSPAAYSAGGCFT